MTLIRVFCDTQEGTRVAKLLATDPEELYKNFLKPKIKVGNEFVTQGRNKDQVSILCWYQTIRYFQMYKILTVHLNYRTIS
jgi:hypothetical protein